MGLLVRVWKLTRQMNPASTVGSGAEAVVQPPQGSDGQRSVGSVVWGGAERTEAQNLPAFEAGNQMDKIPRSTPEMTVSMGEWLGGLECPGIAAASQP